MLELNSADSENQVLTVLCSGKETSVVWTYGKKAVDGTVESTEAAEEPTELWTVFMPWVYLSGPFLSVVCSSRSFLRTSI